MEVFPGGLDQALGLEQALGLDQALGLQLSLLWVLLRIRPRLLHYISARACSKRFRAGVARGPSPRRPSLNRGNIRS